MINCQKEVDNMEFNQTKTFANLKAAYAGESQARVKYAIYAKQAEKQGYKQISCLFNETAENEQAHARVWFTYLRGGTIPDTCGALEDSAGDELFEHSKMYPDFAKQAREEGFEDIAARFELVAKVEAEHEKRFRKLAENMKNQTVFKREAPILWICQECGHIHFGAQAPEQCPICSYPQAYFKEKAQNY